MPALPFKVRAVFDYKSDEPDDLTFANGQIITVTDDDDADWYTGEYTNAAGQKVDGIFPRNFVEKYEPAIPSRPLRNPKRGAVPQATSADEVVSEVHVVQQPVEAQPAVAREEASPIELGEASEAREPKESKEEAAPALSAAPAERSTKPGPPPVAEKPSSSSFKDRIAAFNKPAAAPVLPFKPGAPTASSGFIKKSFVAPPPSKNSYVPPAPLRDIPIQKVYRREEDPSVLQETENSTATVATAPPPAPTSAEDEDEDQPKPTTLKERIALLQKQQLENAQRQADAATKKDKPRKPTKKKTEATDEADTDVVPDTQHESLSLNREEDLAQNAGDESQNARSRLSVVQAPPPVPLPARELVSDTNDADDSGAADTEDAQETSTEEERPRLRPAVPVVPHVESVQPHEHDHTRGVESAGGKSEQAEEQGRDHDQDQHHGDEEEEEEEEEEEDPEIRRRRELRDRMAKISGGMGMVSMFGPPGGLGAAPTRRAKTAGSEHRHPEPQYHDTATSVAARAPPVALPGMAPQLPRRLEAAGDEDDKDDKEGDNGDSDDDDRGINDKSYNNDHNNDHVERSEAAEDVALPVKRSLTITSNSSEREALAQTPVREGRAPPPLPSGARPVPSIPLSSAARAPPPPPPTQQPRAASRVAEDEETACGEEDEADEGETPPSQPSQHRRPILSTAASPASAPPVPPVSSVSPTESALGHVSSPTSRPPPPPPPIHPPARVVTSDSSNQKQQTADDSGEGETEYDGDYDTDIASSAKHKDALKAHNRDSSIDDDVLTDDATKSPVSPPNRAIPPLPTSATIHRDVPSLPSSRKSIDAPKAAPPPIPPPKLGDDDEYDPYRYSAPHQSLPVISSQSPPLQSPSSTTLQPPPAMSSSRLGDDEDMYGSPPSQHSRQPPAPLDRAAPSPPNIIGAAGLGEPPAPLIQSTDIKRQPTVSRRSLDQSRPSGEYGIIASDIDLGHSSFWWTQDNLLPPALNGRNDYIYEMESSTSAKRGGRTTVSRDIYVLYHDYSQTTINATFDQADPSHVTLEQDHQRPPPLPRKDQLEQASKSFGAQIAAQASNFGATGATVADGSAHGFVNALFPALKNALKPVGIRAYGALVYANLANASTQQFDEIRPGDIVTFRNAKFAGHKGGLHQKYSLEVGKPDHAAVVIDWDGTKKKIRAWEQKGDEKGKKAKVREESFRVGDLKSGEVMVWRVMSRAWVGWDKS